MSTVAVSDPFSIDHLAIFEYCPRRFGINEEGRMTTLNPQFVTTANEIPGQRLTRNLGIVRGLVVRSRSVIGNIGATIQTIFGGNITLYTDLCERAREDAFTVMIQHAEQRGANAIVAMRYDANEIGPGITEVLAYGTAVVVEAIPR
jgi:uncharacterized protein YbjQ (UPF0145 family)